MHFFLKFGHVPPVRPPPLATPVSSEQNKAMKSESGFSVQNRVMTSDFII